ncbi:MAG: hypothetical protein K2I42_03070 [Anaeroplasmataceae bacterium]|nr:hypothetical protein [Anaeroplasmataceae bacterium]
MRKIIKVGMIFLLGIIIGISLSSCKEKYADIMLDKFIQMEDGSWGITKNADAYRLGRYGNVDVALFHEESEQDGIALYYPPITLGEYNLNLHCRSCYCFTYHHSEDKLETIKTAYELGWLDDAAIKQIAEKNNEVVLKFHKY